MPRKNMAADRRRSERIEIRVTVDEAHELATRSVSANLSISDYMRKSALWPNAYMQKASPERAALIVQMEELNRMGEALGQIIRSGKYVDHSLLLTETLAGIKTLSVHLIQKLAT